MINSSSTSTFSIEKVNEEALSLLSELLQTVAKALEHKGQTLWTQESLEPSALTEAYPNADMYLALQDGNAVGGMVIVNDDPHFWPEIPVGESLFIHKLAVLPEAQGSGIASRLLSFAQREAQRQDRRYLRLDCAAERPGLCRFYEGQGFTYVGERTVGSFFAALFERVPV